MENQSKKQIEIWKTAQTRWNLKENAAMANQCKKDKLKYGKLLRWNLKENAAVDISG